MAKNKLTDKIRAKIVVRLALMERPSDIRDYILEEHGIKMSLSSIVYYDPTTKETDIAKVWQELFFKTRAKFLADAGRIPITHKVYRMREYQKIHDVEMGRGNTVGARETLKQAAEEEGGAYTNKRELTGKNGAALVPARFEVAFVSPKKKADAAG